VHSGSKEILQPLLSCRPSGDSVALLQVLSNTTHAVAPTAMMLHARMAHYRIELIICLTAVPPPTSVLQAVW
jgi:hypothetical protein